MRGQTGTFGLVTAEQTVQSGRQKNNRSQAGFSNRRSGNQDQTDRIVRTSQGSEQREDSSIRNRLGRQQGNQEYRTIRNTGTGNKTIRRFG
ncbi:unnamed protein product, partial [Staurois parvus]